MSFNRDVWKDREKSLLVKEITEYANLNKKDVAQGLGITTGYYNVVLSRNSFSFEDLLLVIEMAGLNITINREDGTVWKNISLGEMYPEDVEKLHNIVKEKKRKECMEKKAQLEKSEKDYMEKKEQFERSEKELKMLESYSIYS